MKNSKKYHLAVWIGIFALICASLFSFTTNPEKHVHVKSGCAPKGCVFLTLMGEESSDSSFVYKTPERILFNTQAGLDWIVRAQSNNGGWGAGSHSRQEITDPHAVPTDPATTSMVAMALLRNGNTLNKGNYSSQLKRAVEHLLHEVEHASANNPTITDQRGTQIQVKLGANIDVILTAQFFSNLLDDPTLDQTMKSRVKRALNTCVSKIEKAQDHDGSFQGSGWAGVLQSSFATNALEAAQAKGIDVNDEVLERSRTFQKGNLDAASGEVKTEMGAGVVLYSVSGSTRASAKEARKVTEEFEKAKRDGVLPQNAPVNEANLEKIGFEKDEAKKYTNAYNV
ncbi:MAG: hypothetical protein RIA63_12355, partial [Cyclobacteriaceae bacterium]